MSRIAGNFPRPRLAFGSLIPNVAKASPVRVGIVLVAIGMLLGRLSGLFREMTIADVFGVTRSADLVIFVFAMPDLLTNLLVGGAVAAVLIPQYHFVVDRCGKSAAGAMLGRMLLAVSFLGGLISIGLYFTSRLWVPVLGPGFEGQDLATANRLSQIVLFAFPLSAASAVLTAMLQLSNRLFAAVLGTLVLNVTMIVTLRLGQSEVTLIDYAAWAVLAGAAARLLFGFSMLLGSGLIRGMFRRSAERFLTASVAVSYVQAMAGVGLAVCFPVVARAIATQTAGDSAAINYAMKMVEVPVGIFAAIVGLVLLPRLSLAMQSGRQNEAMGLLNRSTILAAASMSACAIVYSFFAELAVRILLLRGEVSVEAIGLIVTVSRVLIWCAPLAVMTALFTAFCHSARNTRVPLLASAASFLLLVIISPVLYSRFGLTGLAFGLLIVNAFHATCLGLFCRRKARKTMQMA